jgi:ABC-type polysaccharide/polyol phosphate transport system ATPase subunit
MPLIEFDGVSKSFTQTGEPKLLRAHLRDRLKGHRKEVFHALKDVSFRVDHGESLAVVGRNGAGKSTLLSLVAGLCPPSEGRVTVRGRVAALLQLGSGFHPDMTGVENIRLNAAMLGLSRQRTKEVMESIVEFAEVGAFVNEPIRTYSSGMVLRLGFAVAIHVDPEILIIDEVLAVGDQQFQIKCLDKVMQYKRAGKTLLFVSHATELIRQFCERALWLDKGTVMLTGRAADVLEAYSESPARRTRG